MMLRHFTCLLVALFMLPGIARAALVDTNKRIFKYDQFPYYVYSKVISLPTTGTYRFQTYDLVSGVPSA